MAKRDKRTDSEPHAFLVTVERERTILERRTVRVIAYTPSSAKQSARQYRPNEGWKEIDTRQGANSAETTRHLPTVEIEDMGVAPDVPADPELRQQALNDRLFAVKVEGEF